MFAGALHAPGCPLSARSPAPRRSWRTPFPSPSVVCHAAGADGTAASTSASCTRRELGAQAARLAALAGLATAAPCAGAAPALAAELTLQQVTPQISPAQPLTARHVYTVGPPPAIIVSLHLLALFSYLARVRSLFTCQPVIGAWLSTFLIGRLDWRTPLEPICSK